MNFSKYFSRIQEAPWYRQFLNSVVEEIENKTKLLDVGTGTGKLLQILSTEKEIECFGIDTSPSMLEEAKKKLDKTSVRLLKIEPNESFPFENNDFDYVTICNVLFNLQKDEVERILFEALKVVKNDGKIVVLTPTGKGNFVLLTKKYFSVKNRSIYIWYNATKMSAVNWSNEKYLQKFSEVNNLKYNHKITLNGFAQIEILKK